jgi:hypothetical protein
MKLPAPGIVTAALIACGTAHGAATVAPTMQFIDSGDAVWMRLRDNPWPVYVPTASYARQGSVFTFDYDRGDGFATGRGDFGNLPITVGELPPGTYTAHARVTSLANASAPPEFTTTYFVVYAPYIPGSYAIPAQPLAYNAWTAVVSSDYSLYPTSLRAAVSGNVVRVTFDYEPTALKGGGPGPAGTATWSTIAVDGLAPGEYTLEFSGTPKGGASATLQYRRIISVQRPSRVVEYYNDTSGHYFISAGPGEVAGLDAPGSGWRRTGESFRAWLSPSDAPAGAVPVCRFYSSAVNSHFYTADAGECGNLKAVETRERSGGKQYSGWIYEGIAFHTLVPTGGACPAGTDPVHRFYNNRWKENARKRRLQVDHLVDRPDV